MGVMRRLFGRHGSLLGGSRNAMLAPKQARRSPGCEERAQRGRRDDHSNALFAAEVQSHSGRLSTSRKTNREFQSRGFMAYVSLQQTVAAGISTSAMGRYC